MPQEESKQSKIVLFDTQQREKVQTWSSLYICMYIGRRRRRLLLTRVGRDCAGAGLVELLELVLLALRGSSLLLLLRRLLSIDVVLAAGHWHVALSPRVLVRDDGLVVVRVNRVGQAGRHLVQGQEPRQVVWTLPVVHVHRARRTRVALLALLLGSHADARVHKVTDRAGKRDVNGEPHSVFHARKHEQRGDGGQGQEHDQARDDRQAHDAVTLLLRDGTPHRVLVEQVARDEDGEVAHKHAGAQDRRNQAGQLERHVGGAGEVDDHDGRQLGEGLDGRQLRHHHVVLVALVRVGERVLSLVDELHLRLRRLDLRVGVEPVRVVLPGKLLEAHLHLLRRGLLRHTQHLVVVGLLRRRRCRHEGQHADKCAKHPRHGYVRVQ
eukprot:Rhum_TRINITY_DN16812_c0_g1::Rhum_TRINITY_DN16812_c0_g1_i1::g.164530::m.164530